jgi:hypothetical protein
MHSHIAIKSGGQPIALNPDTSVNFTEKNPMFNETEAFSVPVEVPFAKNRFLLKNYDDVNSALHTKDFERQDVQLFLEGLPARSLSMVVQEESEVKDALTVNFDSRSKTLRAMIEDMNCQDVQMTHRFQIGEKIGNVSVSGEVVLTVSADTDSGGWDPEDIHRWPFSSVFEPQALGFSYPGICQNGADGVSALPADDISQKSYPKHTVNIPKVTSSFINVSEPYGSTVNSPYTDGNGVAIPWPFCNARVCYTHYDSKTEEGVEETIDSVVQARKGWYSNEDFGPYWVLDANRPTSGVCFYVLYFLDCLFYTLGLSFDKTDLLEIEDFKHLCFFTTKCCYDLSEDSDYSPITFSGRIRDNGDGTTPFTEEELKKPFENINKWLESRGCGGQLCMGCDESKDLETYNNSAVASGAICDWKVGEPTSGSSYPIKSITAKANFVQYNWNTSAKVLKMYANSKNFPDASVTSVLDSLENSFGIRFIYNDEKKSVKATLYRKLFRNTAQPIKLKGELLEMVPVTEKITGVRMCYSAEEDKKTQQGYVRNGVRDYDTDYNYDDYPQEIVVTDKTYKQFFKSLSPTDMHVYIDMTTGNAYRIKIDSEATSADMLAPVMFEVGQFKGIEVGDCSADNEDFVKEIVSDFTPVAFSDVNYYRESANSNDVQPILAVYIDEKMEHEFIPQKLQCLFGMQYANVYMIEQLQLAESYNPTGTENGNSPLQEKDWGMSIAIMRGGGTDMKVITYDHNYDLMGNSKWKTQAGEYALASDTMDHFGNRFDYNGDQEGDGGGERFSLKIRAYKQPSWSNVPLCIADPEVRMRGLADALMAEYIHFLLHRKKYKARMLCHAATLIDIPNHWYEWFEIGGKVGWINQTNYSVNTETGLGKVEIEFFAL